MFIKRKEFDKLMGYYESKIENLESRVGYLYELNQDMEKDFELTISRINEQIEKLKEMQERKIDNNEHDKKSKILKDIQAIQEYSLEDVLDYYMKG